MKLQVKELRIGNYVKLSKKATIDENWFQLSQFRLGTLFLNDKNFEAIEPIPLTEEWLLKFGFEVNKMNGTTFAEINKVKWFLLCKSEYEDFWRLNFLNITKIKYVHQLQNLYFALTGEELEIKPK